MPQFPLNLAAASKDSISINEHFGHAKQFQIYVVSPGSCVKQESREMGITAWASTPTNRR